MAHCAECSTKMGYTETNVAREHNGLCIACHVKSMVKEKVAAANKPHRPTNVKSIDNLFSKFEDMLVTSETTVSFRVRRRLGIVYGEGLYAVKKESFWHKLKSRALRQNLKFYENSLKTAVNDALVELKASALKIGGNAVVGYSINYTNVMFGAKEHIIISVSGTAVEVP